ncbi:hypothetical protein D9M72_506200 [compost metagenome]
MVDAAGVVVPAGAVPPLSLSVVAVESPSRPNDVVPRVIGAVTGATTWVPEARPSEPLVDAAGVVVPAGAVVPLVVLSPWVVAVESPSRPNDVVPTVIGAVTGATTWVPEARPSEPLVVSAALAAVVPRASSPPAKRVLSSPLRIFACMVISPESRCEGAQGSPNGRIRAKAQGGLTSQEMNRGRKTPGREHFAGGR